ncbi:MAG: TonB-dependent receptor [Thermoanaerobaculia bacterium]
MIRGFRKASLILALALAAVGFPCVARPAPGPEPQTLQTELLAAEEALPELSLEELLGVSIVSASNSKERLSDAPATVIVVTQSDIRLRGYTEFSEILDDLPGMDVVRPYGDTYLKNYWRGYRNTIGDPFLFLVDGMVMNHLYYNTADVLVTMPLSNIDRVEVVYGPASSVYGANAFMGVINVITSNDRKENGTSVRATLSGGSSAARIVDANVLYRKDDLRVSATVRLDNGDLDTSHIESYEYTRNRYTADRRLWGGIVDNPNLGGSFLSHRKQRGVDLRVGLGTIELGVQYFNLNSGYGLVYATDRVQNNAVWARPDLNLFLRDQRTLNAQWSSSTLLRYRKSDLSSDSYFVESNPAPAGAAPAQLVDVSYWQALNSSWSLFQDFEFRATQALVLTGGLKYEQKDLQKAYDVHYGPSIPAAQLNASTYPYPTPAFPTPVAQNRITTEDIGVYVQGKYRIDAHHQLNLGIRNDHNSEYGSAATIRAGYVGHFGPWSAKALYGEAFQEPNPRLLYGGWTGSGSDPNLEPERSRTVEVSASYQKSSVQALLSAYTIRNAGTIVNTAQGARNLGDRRVFGVDAHLQAFIKTPGFSQPLRVWVYYSSILQADEKRFDAAGQESTGRIGDLARDRVTLGATALVTRKLSATLRGRYIGRRTTVESNPVRSVPASFIADLTLSANDLLLRGLGFAVKVTNLADAEVFDPGIRDADAGTTPGAFDEEGRWHGSNGFFNSLLPQPGRAVVISARLDF